MIKKIVITGAESSGKSTLAKELARQFNTISIPEYARKYIENLKRPYTYEDVENIAKQQIKILSRKEFENADKFVFFDTGLIITKVWFEYKFKKIPDFLLSALKNIKPDFCLLCSPDLPWIPDKTRENGGKNRIKLFEKYKQELDFYGYNYEIIKGKGKNRRLCALKKIYSAYSL